MNDSEKTLREHLDEQFKNLSWDELEEVQEIAADAFWSRRKIAYFNAAIGWLSNVRDTLLRGDDEMYGTLEEEFHNARLWADDAWNDYLPNPPVDNTQAYPFEMISKADARRIVEHNQR